MIDGYLGSHPGNYNKGRGAEIRFLVLHYTANDGDKAKGNCVYFSGSNRGASAHFFVDEYEVWQSVKEEDTAWHCGTTGSYYHPSCRNKNSIGIEMCSRKDAAGRYYIRAETVQNAQRLVRQLMDKYGIPLQNVLRHYDITGKRCPEPWVRDITQWHTFLRNLKEEEIVTYEQFKAYMQRYETELAAKNPAWGKETWERATEQNIVDGGRPMAAMTRLEYAASELRRMEGK